jgi:NADPH:quinone reductase-like Zn-dependent oxidoreductase
LVRLLATTATYTDLLVMKGNYRPAVPLPATPGYDGVGVIEAVGEGVAGVAVGDRVALMPTHGCMATHVLLCAKDCILIRADLPAEQAVSVVLTGITAYQMLTRASGGRLTPAARILVHGCTGGTGAMIVELAKILGVPPANIYGTCGARNLALAASMGVTAFDYGPGDWDARVRAATGGRGVDLVFDAVVTGGYFSKDHACLARGGKVIAYGVTNAADPGGVSVPAALWAFSCIGMQKLWSTFDRKDAEFFNITRRRGAHPDEFAADLKTLLDLLADGRLRPLVGRVWEFEQAKEALASIESNAHTGKQIVRIAAA